MCRQQKEAENREEGKFGTEEKPKEKNEKAKAKKKKRANGQKNCRVQPHNALPEVKQTKDLCEGAQ